jgi:hypothetical protein
MLFQKNIIIQLLQVRYYIIVSYTHSLTHYIVIESRRQTARAATLKAIIAQQFDLKSVQTRVTTTPVVSSSSSSSSSSLSSIVERRSMAHRSAMKCIASLSARHSLRPAVTTLRSDVVVLNGFNTMVCLF